MSASDRIVFGTERLTWDVADEHFLVVGATGGGKTTILRILMKSTLEGPSYCPPRALVYDPKKEFLPLLQGLGREDDVRILNPFDRRCAAWDMATDFPDPVSARQLATILVPEKQGGHENSAFFDNATRDLLTAVIVTLAETATPGKWEFRDALLGVLYPAYLEALLSHERSRDGLVLGLNSRVKTVYLDADAKTRDNIMASVQARLGLYEPVASVWAQALRSGEARRRFSLLEWSDSQDILLLGNEELGRASIDGINRAIFGRAAEVLLSLPAKDQTPRAERTWIFLDELREAGRIEGIGRLLNKGRAAGVTLALAFQDVEGLRDVYGGQVAGEITGQCGTLAILRLSSPETAKWAASLFGEYLAEEVTKDPTVSGPQVSIGTRTQTVERKNVYSSELMFLPKTSVNAGLTAYYKHSEQGPEAESRRTADWARDIAPNLGRTGSVAAFLPHPSPSIFHLQPWTQEDWERLGYEGEVPDYRSSPPKGSEEPGEPRHNAGPSSLLDED